MDPAHYLEASYYERWLWSAERRMEAKGTIAPGEVEAMMARLALSEAAPTAADPKLAAEAVAQLREGSPVMGIAVSPRFAPGDRVRVRRMHPDGHTRCPRYVRGALGVVERVQGTDRLPDRATYGLPTEPEPVYAVAFASQDLWGESDERCSSICSTPTWSPHERPQQRPRPPARAPRIADRAARPRA
jgi:nitrile hydratase